MGNPGTGNKPIIEEKKTKEKRRDKKHISKPCPLPESAY
jgi:hypothetical protein